MGWPRPRCCCRALRAGTSQSRAAAASVQVFGLGLGLPCWPSLQVQPLPLPQLVLALQGQWRVVLVVEPWASRKRGGAAELFESFDCAVVRECVSLCCWLDGPSSVGNGPAPLDRPPATRRRMNTDFFPRTSSQTAKTNSTRQNPTHCQLEQLEQHNQLSASPCCPRPRPASAPALGGG